MSQLDLQEADFWFRCAALPDDSLRVYRFHGREALNQPVGFTIELVSTDANLDLEGLVDQPARLSLRGRGPRGERYTRHVHGVIERAVQLAAGARHSLYEVSLVSTLQRLAHDRDCRIYQQLSAPDVVRAVLADARVAASSVLALLHQSYGARDYCVQYQESSLQFLARLCEEEGICTFFEHQPEREVLVLGDGSHAFDTVPSYAQVRHRDQPHLYEEGMWALRAESALLSGSTVLRDFRFQQPRLDLTASAQGEAHREHEQYYFPGEYVDPALGQRLARLRLQEQLCLRHRYAGHSNVRALLPGCKFTLSDHRRRACNQEYLVIAVEHVGTQPQALPESPQPDAWQMPGTGEGRHAALAYHNRVECIPASVPFRPARRTARPRVVGVQTAIVVGPPGEEIHCDEYGRVKVQFHWDRGGSQDDHSSCWIRVSQPFSGVGYGALFIPRIGQEVVVQFLDGDPDRPLIVGRVYNGENPVPYGLPAAKTISTIRSASTPGGEGWNELRFNDQKGQEELHLHAQRDLSVIAGHHHSTVVKTGDHTLKVVSGGSLTEVKGQCKTEVAEGDSELWVLTGSHITKAEGPVTIESGQEKLSLLASGAWRGQSQEELTLEAPEITLQASKQLTLRVGKSAITLTGSGIEIEGAELSSSAIGTHTISGAIVAIN